MNPASENDTPKHSPEKCECIEMLQFILDGEATPEQTEFFLKEHLEACMPCYKNYHLEMTIRQLLKQNCSGKTVPAHIIEAIQIKIKSIL